MNSQSKSDSDSFTLEVPADPAYLATIRLFAGSVARHFHCSEDSIDDLKVALTEACTIAMSRGGQRASHDPSILLRGAIEGTRLSFLVPDGGLGLQARPVKEGEKLEAPTEDIVRALGMELIQALFPDAELDTNPQGGTDIKFFVDTVSADDVSPDRSAGIS